MKENFTIFISAGGATLVLRAKDTTANSDFFI